MKDIIKEKTKREELNERKNQEIQSIQEKMFGLVQEI